MNTDLITQRIKKIANDIVSLANDIDNNSLRRQFYSDLMKQRVFELYDLTQEINKEYSRKESEAINDKSFLKKSPPTEASKIVEKNFESEMENEVKVEDKTDPKLHTDNKNNVENNNKQQGVESNDLFASNKLENLNTKSDKTELEENKEEINSENIRQDIQNNESNQENETESISYTTLTKNGTTDWLMQLLDDISLKKTSSKDISHKLQSSPITNFYNTVSISQKHQYIDVLFNSQPEDYKRTIQKIEELGNLNDSIEYIASKIAHKNKWEKNEKLASEFLFLVKRRFL